MIDDSIEIFLAAGILVVITAFIVGFTTGRNLSDVRCDSCGRIVTHGEAEKISDFFICVKCGTDAKLRAAERNGSGR